MHEKIVYIHEKNACVIHTVKPSHPLKNKSCALLRGGSSHRLSEVCNACLGIRYKILLFDFVKYENFQYQISKEVRSSDRDKN